MANMNRRNKYILVFTLIYWFIVFVGIALFTLAFTKVPIGSYGLKANYFNPNIQLNYYTPGLYNTGIGFYFILYPSTKQYIVDNSVNIINDDLQKITVKYTICYRINPDSIYNMYQLMGYQYQQRLSGAINNIISTVFMHLSQNQSRVDAQSLIVKVCLSNTSKIVTSMGNSIMLEGVFINQLNFNDQIELQYKQSVHIINSYSQTYETTQIEYQKVDLQVRALQQSISLLKDKFQFEMGHAYNQQYAQVITTQKMYQQNRQTLISSNYFTKRIFVVWYLLFQYYNSTKMIFIQ